MRSTFLFVAVAAVVISSCAAENLLRYNGTHIFDDSERPQEFSCNGKPDDYYPHPEKCYAYLRCVGGNKVFEYQCTNGPDGNKLYFNTKRLPGEVVRCTTPELADCGCHPQPTTTTTTTKPTTTTTTTNPTTTTTTTTTTKPTTTTTTTKPTTTTTTTKPTTTTTTTKPTTTTTTTKPTTTTTTTKPTTTTTTTKPTTTTTTTTPAPTTTQAEECDECDDDVCKQRGYCDCYESFVTGKWTKLNCTSDLFWLPNELTGGTCAYFDNLPPNVQDEYLKDSACIPECEWFQKDEDICSPRYSYRHPFNGSTEGREQNLECAKPPEGRKPLFWVQSRLVCDSCDKAVDKHGRACSC